MARPTRIYTPAPVHLAHPIHVGKIIWWLTLPHLVGGPKWFDLMGLHTGSTTGLEAGEGWAATTRPGGYGHIHLAGSGSIAAPVTPPAGVVGLSCWFRTTASSAALLGFSEGPNAATAISWDRVLSITGSQLTWYVFSGSTDTIATIAAVNDGKWHHAIGAIGADSVLRLYLDGKLASSMGGVAHGFNSYTHPYMIAGQSHGMAGLAGDIDDCCLYSHWPAGAAADSLATSIYQQSRGGYPDALNYT